MTIKAYIQLKLGETVVLKKPHPCGGHQWRVTRLGADIGLSCLNCGRQIMMPRSELIKSIKAAPQMGIQK